MRASLSIVLLWDAGRRWVNGVSFSWRETGRGGGAGGVTIILYWASEKMKLDIWESMTVVVEECSVGIVL